MRLSLSLFMLAVYSLFCLRGQAQQQDTALLVHLKEVEIKDKRHWKSERDRYQFNQTRYYVTTILPYVHEATALFHDIDQKLNDPGLSKKERKRYVRAKEEDVRNRLEEQIKDLNETQGVLLIKLIARQTGLNIYSILSEFKNPLTAIKWQAWARLNGFSIAQRYKPEKEELLEEVMESLGYPLPPFYDPAEVAAFRTR